MGGAPAYSEIGCGATFRKTYSDYEKGKFKKDDPEWRSDYLDVVNILLPSGRLLCNGCLRTLRGTGAVMLTCAEVLNGDEQQGYRYQAAATPTRTGCWRRCTAARWRQSCTGTRRSRADEAAANAQDRLGRDARAAPRPWVGEESMPDASA